MSTDGIIKIAHIRNLKRHPLQIIVDEPEDPSSTVFEAAGLLTLAPNEVIEVELDRVDLAQLEHFYKKKLIQLLILDRDLDNLTG